MAYFNQDKKAKIAPVIKALLKEYGMKGSLSVRNHSTVVLTLKSGSIDLLENNHIVRTAEYQRRGGTDHWGHPCEAPKKYSYLDVNVYHIDSAFTGKALKFINKVKEILDTDNFDHSDIQSDYFHVGHYVDINIGTWEKPYEVTK